MKLTYARFSFLIRTATGSKNVDVVAVSLDAARADLNEAFCNLEVITVACYYS